MVSPLFVVAENLKYKESGESRDEDLFNQTIFVFIAF